MAKTLYMETTAVPADRTAGEICAELVKAGATQINTSYDAGRVTGLKWVMRINGIDALFSMPARVDPIEKILRSRSRKTWLSDKEKRVLREKAERIAWRQLLRWVQAQNAMIETGMVQAGEVFFAYSVHPQTGQTLFEYALETQFKALPAPERKQ